MDFISTALVTLKQPTGMWVKILNAFKGAGSYIVAVILIAIIVRVIFSVVDVVNKKVNMKNMKINEKMRPELEAIQKKYGNDPKVMQAKQNEIYRKYQFNMMGTCLPMLVTMILQFVVFLTLWNSLQAVANYNIAEKYENMKGVYVSVIELNDDNPLYADFKLQLSQAIEEEKTYDLSIDIDEKNSTLKLTLTIDSEKYIIDDIKWNKNLGLKETYTLLEKYVLEPKQEENPPAEGGEEGGTEQSRVVAFADEATPEQPTEPEVVYVDTGFNKIFKALAEEAAEQYYLETQEGFLWIKNYYKADSPSSPLFTKKEIKSYLSKYYSKEEKVLQKSFDYEGAIFDSVVTAGIGQKKLGHNGYYILTIIAVLVSVFSMWLSNFLMKDKNSAKPQKKSWAMYVIMPLIFGIFTFMYTSLFAVYIITGQLVMIVLTPLTTYLVKLWLAHDEKKKVDKQVAVVDYRRDDVQNTRKMYSPKEKKEEVIEVDYRRKDNPNQFSSMKNQSKKRKKDK